MIKGFYVLFSMGFLLKNLFICCSLA